VRVVCVCDRERERRRERERVCVCISISRRSNGKESFRVLPIHVNLNDEPRDSLVSFVEKTFPSHLNTSDFLNS